MSATVDKSIPWWQHGRPWQSQVLRGLPEPHSHFPPGFSARSIEAGLAPPPSQVTMDFLPDSQLALEA